MEQFHTAESKDELLSVISRMCKLGDDEEPEVRAELLYSLPYIALFCRDHSEDLNAVIRQQVVPYTVKLLTDDQITIRKFGHASLKILVENKILDNSQLKDWICPLLAELVLSKSTPEELRSEDVSPALMSEAANLFSILEEKAMCSVVPYIERDITEKFFLSPFLSLCCDSSFIIRKGCAVNFSSFCEAMEVQTIERSLLPAFFSLCCDKAWGVRKECANVFGDVARLVSPSTREILCSHFINLLNDESHHVKFIAYKALGGFISSFAPSALSSFEERFARENSNKPIENENQNINKSNAQPKDLNFDDNRSTSIQFISQPDDVSNKNVNILNPEEDKDLKYSCNHELASTQSINSNYLSEVVDQNDNAYNYFQFWRTPLPDVDPALVLETFEYQNSESLSNEDLSSPSNNVSHENRNRARTIYDQKVIPHKLLSTFKSGLKNPELTPILAYNFCAVAHTLGRKNWSSIREVFFVLASNPNECVRATVASFLHELAAILGKHLTAVHLLPIALTYANDVDAVCIKLLTYLSRFLQHLRPSERKLFLPFIRELLELDPERNWRSRFTVVEQLLPCVSLYKLSEVNSHFLPISLAFLNDRASAVRRSAIRLFCEVVKLFMRQPDYKSKALLLLDNIGDLTWSDTWLQRQKYVYICDELACQRSLSNEMYIEKIVPNLIVLAADKVPNVRLAVARCICCTLTPLGYVSSICEAHKSIWPYIVSELQNDRDRDVRSYFSNNQKDFF